MSKKVKKNAPKWSIPTYQTRDGQDYDWNL